MKLKFIRGTALGGIGNDAAPGEVREVPDAQAAQLVASGRAIPFTETAPEPAAEEKTTRKKAK